MPGRVLHLCLFLSLLLTPCLFGGPAPAGASPADTPLSGKSIRKLVGGYTARVTFVKSGETGFCYFSPDGGYIQLVNNWLDRGRWSVNKKDRLCVNVIGGKKKCRFLVEKERGRIEQYIAKKSGDHRLDRIYETFTSGDKVVAMAQLSSPPLEKLSKEEIRALFIGKTVESQTVRKGRLSLTSYYSDGTLVVARHGHKYQGTWRVTKRDRMCLQLMDSKEKCRFIVRQGDRYGKYIVKKDGKHQQSIRYLRFMEGNQF